MQVTASFTLALSVLNYRQMLVLKKEQFLVSLKLGHDFNIIFNYFSRAIKHSHISGCLFVIIIYSINAAFERHTKTLELNKTTQHITHY